MKEEVVTMENNKYKDRIEYTNKINGLVKDKY